MAEALYRKYRPQVFSDVVGQDPIVRTLQNAIQADKVSHAYLFCGPRGTGKTTMARLLAKALLCKDGPTPQPDGNCEECTLIATGNHPDVYELDAASRTGVENVRDEIIGRVQFAPTRGKKKIYIIDEVHMLSTAAFNALLKTLEEPPEHVIFILCTTDPQKVLPTILSRCQRFDFKRIGQDAMVSKLGAVCMAENVKFEGEALELIAYRADGGMRNALTSLEQLMSFGENSISLSLAEDMLGSLNSTDVARFMTAVGTRDIAAGFEWIDGFVDTGGDIPQFARDLAEYIRNLYVLSLDANAQIEISSATRNAMNTQLHNFNTERLQYCLCVIAELITELRNCSNLRLSLEVALVRMARPQGDLTLESLAERIEYLEEKLSTSSSTISSLEDRTALNKAGASSKAMYSRDSVSPNNSAPTENPAPPKDPVPLQNPAPSEDPTLLQNTAPTEDPELEQTNTQKTLSPEQEFSPDNSEPPYTETPSENFDRKTSSANGIWEPFANNQAQLQKTWQRIMAALKRENSAYAVLFMNAKPVYLQEKQCLHIEFPQRADFTFNTAKTKTGVIESLKAAIEEVVGSNAAFDIVKALAPDKHTDQSQAPYNNAATKRADTPSLQSSTSPNNTTAKRTEQSHTPSNNAAAKRAETSNSQSKTPPNDVTAKRTEQSQALSNSTTAERKQHTNTTAPQTDVPQEHTNTTNPQNESWQDRINNFFEDADIKKL